MPYRCSSNPRILWRDRLPFGLLFGAQRSPDAAEFNIDWNNDVSRKRLFEPYAASAASVAGGDPFKRTSLSISHLLN